MNEAQPAKFVAVGAGGYMVNLAAFALLSEAGVQYGAAASLAYVVANGLMYLGNRYFTFGMDNDGFWGAYLRYACVGALVAVLNVILLAILVEVMGLADTLGLAFSLLLITPVAFVLNRRWTFRLAGESLGDRAVDQPGDQGPERESDWQRD